MNRPNRKLYRLAWLLIPIIILSACGLGNASEVKTTTPKPGRHGYICHHDRESQWDAQRIEHLCGYGWI